MDRNRCPICGQTCSPDRAGCDVCAPPADRGCGAIWELDAPRGRLPETGADQDFGHGLPGLLARAVAALVTDAGSSPSVRRRGLRHMAIGFLTLVAWFGILAAVAWLLLPHAPQPAPARKIPTPGDIELLLLTVFPPAWATLKIQIGLFQVVTGMRFRDFYHWVEHLPIWRQLLIVPVIVVVVVALVVATLVGTLGLCGALFRLATR